MDGEGIRLNSLIQHKHYILRNKSLNIKTLSRGSLSWLAYFLRPGRLARSTVVIAESFDTG